jgi:hypothetical protein
MPGPLRLQAFITLLLVTGLLMSWEAPLAASVTNGEATVGLTYEYFSGGDHLFSTDAIDGLSTRGYVAEGKRWDLGDTDAHTILGTLDLGLPRGFALILGAAWVTSSYRGTAPVNPEIDDGLIRGYPQDGRIGVRRPFDLALYRVTPQGSVSFPLSDYPVNGHATPGSGFITVLAGLEVQRGLGAYASFGQATLDISYGFVTNVDEARLTRLTTGLNVTHFLSRRASLYVTGHYSEILGGLDWVSGGPGTPAIHGAGGSTGLDTRVAAARAAWVGVGADLSVSNRWRVGAGVHHLAWGENVEDGLLLSLALRTTFQWWNRITDESAE